MFVCNARSTGTILYLKEYQKSKIRHNFSADFLNEKLRRNDTKISEFQFEVLENGLEISLCEDKNGKNMTIKFNML